MDRKMLEDHHRLALGHVALGREHIAKQIRIISELEDRGRDSTMARTLLITFENMQATHEADLHRLEKELAR